MTTLTVCKDVYAGVERAARYRPQAPELAGPLGLLSLGITPLARRSAGGSHAPQPTPTPR